MNELSDQPRQFSDCCLSLSQALLDALSKIIHDATRDHQHPLSIFSIGCGTGLFESVLEKAISQNSRELVTIHGVEVTTASTPYLPIERVHRVHGTWDIYHPATTADILIFVYPRQCTLVDKYMKLCHSTTLIAWLGPRADWEEHHQTLSTNVNYHVETVEDARLPSFEILVVFRNLDPKRSRSALDFLPRRDSSTLIDAELTQI